jgi:transposase
MVGTTMAQPASSGVVVGVDTHKDTHVARAKDALGRRVGEQFVPTTPAGHRQLLAWARGLGDVEAFGVEGTGSYGAGLARYLRSEGEVVIEVIRPDRQVRRRNGKSDPADADAAASAVLSGDAAGLPKAANGQVEMIRTLRVARSTAVKARTQAVNALKALVVTAPSDLREQLRASSTTRLVYACARLRPGELVDPTAATKVALRSLATRYEALEAELERLNATLARLIGKPRPSSSLASGSARTRRAHSSWPPATTPAGSVPRPPSPCSAAPRRLRRPRARSPATVSTEAVIVRPMPPSTTS